MDNEPKFSIPKREYYKVFACPDCGKSMKRFNTLRELNIHSAKVHPEKNTKYIIEKAGRIRGIRRIQPDIKSMISKMMNEEKNPFWHTK